MALTPITSGSTTTAKQVAVANFQTTSGTVLYTVPSGKTCTGVLFGSNNQNQLSQAGITISGVQTVVTLGLTTSAGTPSSNGAIPVTLVAGTSLSAVGSNAGNGSSFIGIEQ